MGFQGPTVPRSAMHCSLDFDFTMKPWHSSLQSIPQDRLAVFVWQRSAIDALHTH